MMALGKRTRSSTASQEASSAPSCNKRPRVNRVNDENLDPDIFHDAPAESPYKGSCGIDNLEDPFVSYRGRRLCSRTSQAVSPASKTLRSAASPILQTCIGSVFEDTEVQEPIQLPTPQTPRHRDALSKKIPITPRRLLTQSTALAKSRTPRTPVTPSNIQTVYHDARQAFVRSADPGRLIGRDAERHELENFVREGVTRRSGRCLYVSGPPGTGKSALVREACQDLGGGLELQKASVNCMSVKAPGDLYKSLVTELLGEYDGTISEQEGDLYSRMAPKAKSHGPVYLVVLDELDRLLDVDLEVLYKLFELALRQSSRLILIGIANALDLTDRFLPRLKARNLKPQLLPFLPYTAPQVALVITAKLRELVANEGGTPPGFVPFVHPTAIEFCSKKVAAQTGDLRKAFDIIHRALTLVENETKQKHQKELYVPMSPSKRPLCENPNLSSPSKSRSLAASLATITPTTAPRVNISHIARISASALGHGTSQRLQTLNLQQKAALCALVSLERRKRSLRRESLYATPSKASVNSSPTIRELYGTYSSLCRRDNALHPLTAVEFCDVIGGLETLGLVGEGEAKGMLKGIPGKKSGKGEDKRVFCWVSKVELEPCLNGAGGGILKGLLLGDD